MNKVFTSCLYPLIVTFLSAGQLSADQGQWKYSTGLDFSSGDYGGDPVDTDITYIPFTAAYQQDQWTFKATLPWVQIEGAGTVVGAGDGGVVVGGAAQNTFATKESGLGDIWVTAQHSVAAIPAELFYLDVSGKLKLPTADEDKGLGTGELDYTVQAEVFKSLDAFTPFATLAYKFKGDPNNVKLKNVWYVSVGSDYRLSGQRHVGASIDYQQASSSTGDDALELFAYANQKLNPKWTVTVYGYVGLMDGSPDYGTGFQLAYKP